MNHSTNRAVVLALSLLGCSLVGCGDKGDGKGAPTGSAAAATGAKAEASAKPEAPKGPVFKTQTMGVDMQEALVDKELVGALAGLVITAPEKAKVSEERGGIHVVSAGVNYSVSISEQKFDKAETLKIYKMIDEKGAVVDESDTHLIFKRESGSHLLTVGLTVDGKPYQCSSVATGFDFTKDQIDQTLTSCRTLKKKG